MTIVSAQSEQRAGTLRLLLPAALTMIFIAALAARWLVMPNANIAWLLTVGERMLDGQRVYVDTVETNPPMSIWLYLPAVVLGRALHLRAEWITDAIVFLAAGLALRATITPLRRAALLNEDELTLFTLACAVVLVLLPAACFGEREHIALMGFLPFAARATLRANGHALTRGEILVSAGCIGLMLAIKPHFALAVGAVALMVVIARRDWRLILAPDYVLAAVLTVIYAIATMVLHPEFWSIAMPLNAALYLPIRYPLAAFARQFSDLLLAFIALLAFAALRGWKGSGAFSTLIGAGAIGFLAAVILQGKGMPYHFYPALALAVLVPFTTRDSQDQNLPAPRLLAAGLACVFWTWFNAGFDMRALVPPIRQAAAEPRVLALGYDFSAGPPMARAAGGRYVGRDASQWIADNAEWLKRTALDDADRSRLETYVEQDRAWFIEDLLTQKPDVLLIQRGPDDWQDFAAKDARFKSALADFDLKGTYGSAGMRTEQVLTYDVWQRHRPSP